MEYDLECVDVYKRFGEFTAVDGVTFQIPRGSFFSILGPSGCGKTTLLRMIAGFETPSSGDILINGKSVLATPPNKRNAKMVFQHLALFPMMNVRDNIAYGLHCRGIRGSAADKRIHDVLGRVGLPDAGNKEIHQLSGGQKQRIAIARCMVLEPEVLLLDEPLGALDLKLRERMKVELKMLQREFATTFIYITHDQSEALVMSDQVAVMNNGKFEQMGEPQELYHQPRTTFVAGFVGDSNQWQGEIVAVSDGGAQVRTPNGLLFNVTTESAGGVGAKASVFVRPEAISVTAKSDADGDGAPAVADDNVQNGKVSDVLFNGAASRVLARTESGDLIEAALPQASALSGLRAGDAVHLRWRAAQCRCFPLSQ